MASYTEFYCNAGTGSNVNGGDNGALAVTSTNGAYTRAAGAGGHDRFVASSGTPFSGLVAGQFVSVYLDGGTVAAYVARVLVVNSSTSIDISITAFAGTRPATAASGVTVTLGGKWKGPNAAESFPFGFMLATLQNSSSHLPRVNLENGTTYATTAAISHNLSLTMGMVFEGCTATPGDGGKFLVEGDATTAHTILSIGANAAFVDLRGAILTRNGSSGAGSGLAMSGVVCCVQFCVVHDVRGQGIRCVSSCMVHECESYACNQSNTAEGGGFVGEGAGSVFVRCISHDNVTSNTSGFLANTNIGNQFFLFCISDSNGSQGIRSINTHNIAVLNCDAYNNQGSGLACTSGAMMLVQNCNFIKNGAGGSGFGISASAGHAWVSNCGFGAGTQANASGTITGTARVREVSNITYAADVTPWVDPANGDFRINLAAAKNAGRGAYTQTAASYAGTVGYPDIGAAQHLSLGVYPVRSMSGGI